jgi:hypothetical protein
MENLFLLGFPLGIFKYFSLIICFLGVFTNYFIDKGQSQKPPPKELDHKIQQLFRKK